MDATDPIGAAIAATAATIAAPASLRASVAWERAAAHRRRRRAQLLAATMVGLAAATAIVLALVLPSGPTVTDAAGLALEAPSAPSPGPGAVAGTLDASVDGVAFPTWPGWEVVGQRAGTVDGRGAHSVVYADRAGRRVGYVIVAGDALDVPEGRRDERHGAYITSLRHDGATIVTWRVRGHTCVMATRADVPVAKLVRFAATTY